MSSYCILMFLREHGVVLSQRHPQHPMWLLAARNNDLLVDRYVTHVGPANQTKDRSMTTDSDRRRTETAAPAENLRSGAESCCQSGVDTLHDMAGRANDSIHSEVERATAALKEQIRHAKLLTDNASRALQHRVAEHPVSSIAIAAGVGVLIGMVILRRGSRP